MKLTIVEELLKAKVSKRKKILVAMHEKNLAYFRQNAPPALVQELVTLGSGRFEMRLNDTFLDILDRKAGGACCHPPGRLLDYSREFGSWHHTAWLDRLSVTHVSLANDEHSRLRTNLINDLYDRVPDLLRYRSSGEVVLPRTKDGRRYSGTTIFLGVFSGLHIVHYLNTTVLKDAIFIEPDVECLALSCFFLDYTAIHRRFGRLVLHAGTDLPENPIDYLVSTASVTSAVWLRMLPAYPSTKFEEIIRRVSIRWNAFHEIRVHSDQELKNLDYGAKHLKSGRPILATRPALSKSSRIVVVGSGPSLEHDLPWLAANRDKFIVICAHSAGKVLKRAGITPDFYCMLDTELEGDLLAKLDMDADVPMLAYYKANPEILAHFREVLLFHEENKANVVDFKTKVMHTHPTTGNTAVALAAFFEPSTLYLAGMDLGFRDASKSHAAGTWHDDEGGAGHATIQASDNLKAESNFPESAGEIYTYSYLNNARATIEVALMKVSQTVRVVNLSDGVRIAYASPAHSVDEQVAPYPNRASDLDAIRASFSDRAAPSWRAYPRTATETLDGFRNHLRRIMTLREFDWLAFGRAVDNAWNEAATQSVRDGGGDDFRVEAFAKLIHDLLMDWYRVLCLSRTKSEADAAYAAGLKSFSAVLDELKYGPELVDFDSRCKSATDAPDGSAPVEVSLGNDP